VNAKILPLLAAVFFCGAAGLQAQDQPLILRRVFFGAVAFQGMPADPLLARIPSFLTSSLTSLEPIIVVTDPAQAYSRIDTTVSAAGPDALAVEVRLSEKGAPVDSVSTVIDGNGAEHERLKAFIEETAARLAPRLGKVPPEVRVSPAVKDEAIKNKVDDIEFAEGMAKPNELALEAGSLSKILVGIGDSIVDLRLLLPVTAVWTRYVDKYDGLQFLLSFEWDDAVSFSAHSVGSGSVPEKSNNLFILPGFGYVVRSLGRLSTAFSLRFLAGAARVQAIDASTKLGLAPGESTWLFVSYLSLSFALCYNFSPSLSLRLQTGILLNPIAVSAELFNLDVGYAPEGATLEFRILCLGGSWRF
jgi:hypothetical protein